MTMGVRLNTLRLKVRISSGQVLVYEETEGKTERETNRQTDGPTARQTDGQTDLQTDRHTDSILPFTLLPWV
jgi:hypothetical protein